MSRLPRNTRNTRQSYQQVTVAFDLSALVQHQNRASLSFTIGYGPVTVYNQKYVITDSATKVAGTIFEDLIPNR